MTVGQLKNILEGFDDRLEVVMLDSLSGMNVILTKAEKASYDSESEEVFFEGTAGMKKILVLTNE